MKLARKQQSRRRPRRRRQTRTRTRRHRTGAGPETKRSMVAPILTDRRIARVVPADEIGRRISPKYVWEDRPLHLSPVRSIPPLPLLHPSPPPRNDQQDDASPLHQPRKKRDLPRPWTTRKGGRRRHRKQTTRRKRSYKRKNARGSPL